MSTFPNISPVLPELRSANLVIRPLVESDLDTLCHIYRAAGWEERLDNPELARAHRLEWLRWQTLRVDGQARLMQAPHGERGVVSQSTGQLVGTVGLVPCQDCFGQLPSFGGRQTGLTSSETGLFWLIDPAHQNRGYATEAAAALVQWAFESLRVHRLVATTMRDNLASQAVMRKLGMQLEDNPFPEPAWLQRVGILWHPDESRR